MRRCWLSVCGSYPGWGKKPNGGIEEQGAGVMAGGERGAGGSALSRRGDVDLEEDV